MITANLRPTAMAAFLSPCFFASFNPHTFKKLQALLRVIITVAASVSKVRTSLEPHFEIRPF